MAVAELAKSTNGRSNSILPVLGRAASAVAPGLTAAAFAHLWLRTSRRRPTAREQDLLAACEHHRLQVDGLPLAVWTRGDGPTVLLVHGWSGRASQLAGFVQPLVVTGHRVVLFDHPGHGATPGRSSNIVRMAEAVAAVGEVFGPVHGIVAHSAGAMATTWALRGGLAAQRLVYLAPGTDLERMSRDTASALGLSPAVERRLREHVERRVGVRWNALDPVRHAALLAQPLLVVHDRGDRQVPVADGARLVDAWPGAELVLTRGLGHQRLLWDAAVIARAVAFVAGAGDSDAPAIPGAIVRHVEARRTSAERVQ